MLRRCLFLVGLCAVAACNANNLAPADTPNTVDTVTLGALSKAPLSSPAGLDVTTGLVVRTDQNPEFDFVYDVDSLGRHLFMPLASIKGLGSTSSLNPGFQKQSVTFDQLTVAPGDPWVTTDTVVASVGDVYALRSRVACYLLVPQYGKLQVLSFDDVAHTVTLEVLSDANCGYKNLQVGVPTN